MPATQSSKAQAEEYRAAEKKCSGSATYTKKLSDLPRIGSYDDRSSNNYHTQEIYDHFPMVKVVFEESKKRKKVLRDTHSKSSNLSNDKKIRSELTPHRRGSERISLISRPRRATAKKFAAHAFCVLSVRPVSGGPETPNAGVASRVSIPPTITDHGSDISVSIRECRVLLSARSGSIPRDPRSAVRSVC